ncbi:hypothetical protein [Oceanicella actignis]|uniref:PH domain-containing protein n=1 Tax=Oceanicella actignis TaxID=1189325 RepID=A0A1M7T1N2_9RHOB|nr:hypothetical protein [Oceanicella actignis]SET38295.1 hypothetical protein SAMN04488119_10431 [Oceanicella actignis]SHN64670.1 hypothetical protein SAMN05216200_10431 [Oceanicella actignis]
MARFLVALAFVALGWLLWRNLAQTRPAPARRKLWDAPLRPGHVAILRARPACWGWWAALVAATAVLAWTLYERVRMGQPLADAPMHLALTLIFAAAAVWRFVQLTEHVTVTWDRIRSQNILGPRYDVPIEQVSAVSESGAIALADGRALELSPWLEGRRWLAHELRARLEARR